jgi:hypothetical protein
LAAGPSASDERPHRPGPEALWAESWDFDYAAADGSLGGYVRLGLYPHLGVAWYWAALVGSGRPLVAVRDHDVALPRRSAMEVRAEGLWSSLNCETPHDHWSVGLEAFAVAMDDAADAYRGERGERTALGLDLEWEASAPVFTRGELHAGAGRYEQACSVYGDVLVGDERLDFSGWGRRQHWWGIQDWWAGPAWAAAGRLDDGRAFAGWPDGGYVADSGDLLTVGSVVMDTVADPDGLPVSATLGLGNLLLAVTPLAHAPVLVEGPGGRSARLARALCRYESPSGAAGAAGGAGVGWAEWLG